MTLSGRKKLTSMFLAFLCLVYSSSALAQPVIKEITGKEGDKIWFIEDHSIPVIQVKIAFKNSGSSYDSPQKSGIAYVLAQMLDEGAGNLSDIQFKKRLEEMAIEMDFDVDKDNFYASIKTLSENRKNAFEMLGMALTVPQFGSEAAQRVSGQLITSLTQKMEDPYYLSGIKWDELYFGSHPYSQPMMGKPETVSDIRRKDIVDFMRMKFVRSNMVVSVVGDISEKELDKLAYEYLYVLPKTPPNIDTPFLHNMIQEFIPPENAKTISLHSPNPQSVAAFGLPWLPYKHPDFYASHIINYVLGGGEFESRLMKEIREKEGLAYSVYTYPQNYDHASVLSGAVGTRKAKIKDSLDIIRKEIKKIHEHGITQEELESAKSYLTGSFAIKLDSNKKLMDFLTFVQLNDLGIDFFEKRNNYIEKITLNDVNRVASQLLDDSKLFTVVIGENEKQDK